MGILRPAERFCGVVEIHKNKLTRVFGMFILEKGTHGREKVREEENVKVLKLFLGSNAVYS